MKYLFKCRTGHLCAVFGHYVS